MFQTRLTSSPLQIRPRLPKLSLLSLAVGSLFVQLNAQTLPAVTITSATDYVPDAGIATKTDTPAREVPFTSSTVGRALLQDRGVTSMNDALATVPGVAAIKALVTSTRDFGSGAFWPPVS